MTNEDLLKIISDASQDGRTELDLRSKKITELPAEIGSLVNLQVLSLSGNQLTELPAEIGKLLNLETLYLSDNQLTALPQEIGDLVGLSSISVERNRLSVFPAGITKLINLSDLNLAGNDLLAIPPEIKNLMSLRSLSLDENPIAAVPPELKELSHLITLFIDGSQLRNWAEVLVGSSILNIAILNEKNSFDNIGLEIIQTFKTGQDLVDYYFKTQSSESKALNEAKLIIIGQGNVGKTSLRQRLIGGPYENKGRTEGVEITKWKTEVFNAQTKELETVKLNVWDFGGQEVYHTTHQFFFRSRCLYILVIDARLGVSESRLYYWLRQAQAFGKDAPILVVLNKAEEKDAKSIDRRYEKEREIVLSLKEMFPNIFDCILVSCDKDLEIDKVEQQVSKAISEKMPEVFSAIPGKWFEVKEKLEALNQNYITEENFDEICAQVPEEERKQLAEILDALGIIVSFEGGGLSDTKIIKPEWITKGIYKILSSYKLGEKNGRVSPEEIAQMLANDADYPAPKVEYILRLMENYDLCYRETAVDGTKNLLFPVAFPVQERKHQPLGTTVTQFEYRYKNEYYDSIIVRFLKAAYEEYGSDFYYWRKGLTGRLNGHQIYVLADDVSNRIEIKIDGDSGGRCELLEEILANIDKIHKDFGKLEVEKVLLHPKNGNSFQYEQVVLRRESGKPSIGYINNEGDAVNVPIDYLLDGIEGEEIKEEEVSDEIKRLEEAVAGLRKSDNQQIAHLKERIGEVFAELKQSVSDSEKIKNGLDNEAEKIVKIYSGVLFFCMSFVLMLWIVLILWIGWDIMEKWTYIAGILSLILFYGIMFLTLSEPNPLKFFEKRKEKARDILYQEFGFDIITHEKRKQKLKHLKP